MRNLTAYSETRITGEYLVLVVPEQQEVLSYQLEMLRLNPHQGILPVEKRRANDQQELCYMLRDNILLKTFLAKKFKIDKVLQILESLLHILLGCRNHLLYSCCFLLETKYIYINPQTGSIALAYLPLYPEHEIAVCLERFLRQFIREVNLENEEDICVLQQIESFCDKPEISISGVLELIKDLRISFYGNVLSQQKAHRIEKPFRLSARITDKDLEVHKSYAHLKKRPFLHWFVLISFVLSSTGLLYRFRAAFSAADYPLIYGSIIVLIAAGIIFTINRYSPSKMQAEKERKNKKLHSWQEHLEIKLAHEQGILRREICRHKTP